MAESSKLCCMVKPRIVCVYCSWSICAECSAIVENTQSTIYEHAMRGWNQLGDLHWHKEADLDKVAFAWAPGTHVLNRS